jgi:hypothetical protein
MCLYVLLHDALDEESNLEVVCTSGRSLKRVNIGHRTAPCGTPLITPFGVG